MTLTQAASFSKKAFLSLIGLMVLGTIIYIGYHIYYYNYYLPRQPKPEIKPEVKYGVLPKPLFNPSVTSGTNLNYVLNTTTGSLPTDLPKLLKVYFVPQLGTTLLAPDHARDLASNLSFISGPEILNQTDYRFTDLQSGVMSIDLTTANFKLVRPNPSNTIENSNINFESSDRLIQTFTDYLGSKGLMVDTISGGRTKVSYNGLTANNSTRATISIWPKDIGELPVVTPNTEQSLVYAVVSKFQDSPDHYLKLNYTIWVADENNASTYPLKTPDQAFADLKSGQGSILQAPNGQSISITGLSLAYFESDTYLPYIEPVYIFQGDNFLAYIAAIDSPFLAK